MRGSRRAAGASLPFGARYASPQPFDEEVGTMGRTLEPATDDLRTLVGRAAHQVGSLRARGSTFFITLPLDGAESGASRPPPT